MTIDKWVRGERVVDTLGVNLCIKTNSFEAINHTKILYKFCLLPNEGNMNLRICHLGGQTKENENEKTEMHRFCWKTTFCFCEFSNPNHFLQFSYQYEIPLISALSVGLEYNFKTITLIKGNSNDRKNVFKLVRTGVCVDLSDKKEPEIFLHFWSIHA